MASISYSGGRATIQFVDVDDKRRSIRLGAVPKRMAAAIKRHVEELLNAKIANTSVARETAEWLAGIGADLADKLAAVGLIVARQSRLLGEFVAEYIASRTDTKAATRISFRGAGNRLVSFLGADRTLESVTRRDIERWRIHLGEEGYSPATIGRSLKLARQFFQAGVDDDLLTKNPCAKIKGPGQENPERLMFVNRETIGKVLDVADREWRLIIALARFGGLRVPSELEPLKLSDIDFERGRMRVTSPKTEHHVGKGERWIPLFPELRPHVEAAFDSAPAGEVYLVRHPCLRQRGATVNLRKGLKVLLRKAGLTPWPRLFQNLRASRETELSAEYPLHVVCAWIGNSARIAQKHYLQVTDEDYERAAKAGAVDREALQKAVQTVLASDEWDLTQPIVASGFSHPLSTQILMYQGDRVGAEGIEPPTNTV